MDSRIGRIGEKINLTNNYKVVESHDRPCPDGKQPIQEEVTILVKQLDANK